MYYGEVRMKKHKMLKKLFVLLIATYIIFIFANQQKTLNQYSKNSDELKNQIEQEKRNKEELAKQKEDITSLDFIEKAAREKLDMYYPNERVYIDRGM